jgi:hypothetical protein
MCDLIIDQRPNTSGHSAVNEEVHPRILCTISIVSICLSNILVNIAFREELVCKRQKKNCSLEGILTSTYLFKTSPLSLGLRWHAYSEANLLFFVLTRRQYTYRIKRMPNRS